MPSAQLETPPQSFIPMPAPPDIQWSNLLCYSGNQALGTNTCDTVPRADGKPCERKRERTSGVHHRLTSAPLKYFDAGPWRRDGERSCAFFSRIVSSSITAEDSTYIWSPRPKHTHALRLVPWCFLPSFDSSHEAVDSEQSSTELRLTRGRHRSILLGQPLIDSFSVPDPCG